MFGYNRIGFNILRSFKKINKRYIVVDYNPEVISSLEKYKLPAVYGDAYDLEFLNDLPLKKVKLVVSTIPDKETSMLLIETIRAVNKDAIIILTAHQIEDALLFYKKKASYVLTPHFLGGAYVAKMIEHLETDKVDYRKEKTKNIEMLTELAKRGKRHPEVEKG